MKRSPVQTILYWLTESFNVNANPNFCAFIYELVF